MAFGSPQWMYKSGEAYELEQSLKFDNSGQHYLTRTPAANGNRRTWTMSYWVKYTSLLDHRTHFGGSLAGSASIGVMAQFDGNTRQLMIVDYRAGYNIDWVVKSDDGFRDPSAWYHIVIAIDTTQATAANRVKLYANGVELGKTAYTPTYPSQNFETKFNQNNPQIIGGQFDNLVAGNFFDGYLTEMNFIDGQALTPADFGETGTYGEWKPKEYSGTYGTNGFYLPFKQDYSVEGFSTVTWKGNGSDGHYIGGTGFKPSLSWMKERSSTSEHRLFDRVRGESRRIVSNSTAAEAYDASNLQTFANDGFTLGNSGSVNASSDTYVAWNWDMGADTPTGFGCAIYTGNGGTQDLSLGFEPDLVWFKGRSNNDEPRIMDSVRGLHKTFKPHQAVAEDSDETNGLTKYTPSGVSIGSQSTINTNGNTYVVWSWDMGDTTATNTSGNSSSQVRANTTYGQSIVSWTMPSSGSTTVGHGLNSTPELIIQKRRDGTSNWSVYTATTGKDKKLLLHDEVASANSGDWDNTAPTSNLFTSWLVNGTANMIAYCFHSVSGYSKIGSYTGTGGTHTITTGFRPSFLIIKASSAASDWNTFDSTRNPLGSATKQLALNTSATEATNTDREPTFLDTGFSIGDNDDDTNKSGTTYIYYAVNGGMDSISDYNDTGSIDSRVKANPTYGQSIVSWTGNGGAATVGHGLSSAPEFWIVKNRDASQGWLIPFSVIDGSSDYMRINDNSAKVDWSVSVPTSSLLNVDGGASVGASGVKYIAYCFHSVTGYSKFGSYTGDGTSDGSHTISTGFTPAFVMIKCSSHTDHWFLYDTMRGNGVDLRANSTDADASNNYVTLTSTGFSLPHAGAGTNSSGRTYIYMAFADKREYAYWLDQSGNNNDWTSNNLTESDISVDSPTNNFPTFNPLMLAPNMGTVLSEGNLKNYEGSSYGGYPHSSFSTMSVTSGKWYFETKNTTTYGYVGILNLDGDGAAVVNDVRTPVTNPPSDYGGGYGIDISNGIKENGNTRISYGSGITSGDKVMCAFDVDAGKIWWGKNGTWFASGNPATAANPAYTGQDFGSACPFVTTQDGSTSIINFGQDSSFAGSDTAQGNQDGNSIGDFYYTPPTGFLALCTSNLPNVAVTPSEHFNTVLYTGTDATNSTHAISGIGFSPSFVWTKDRDATYGHYLFDAVRGTGVTKGLRSNTTDDEGMANESYDALSSFDSDGFSITGGAFGSLYQDRNNANYVAWNWKANGSGSSNTAGSINSTVSANVDAGFSIVSYTGTGSTNQTVGHGLSSAPEMLMIKNRTDASYNWYVYHHNSHEYAYNRGLYLNSTSALVASSAFFGATPTSSVFTIAGSGATHTNISSKNYIAYCFHSVDGYSKVGSYTGNGSTDGTFVYTGFKPAMVIMKVYDTTESWGIFDNARDPDNQVGQRLHPSASSAESTASSSTSWRLDFTANGFKWRGSDGPATNGNGNTYIYIAFAETPFKYSNAR